MLTTRTYKFSAPLGSRAAHWYHNGKRTQQAKDVFEYDNRKPEFGRGRITDHDRNPQHYIRLNKGRTVVTRVFDVRQWGFNKDWFADLGKDKFLKMSRYKKLDALDFLEARRHDYVWLPDDADGAIGYISDEDDDEINDSPEFGTPYLEATPEYRDRVLKDRCLGRPVYDWQLPFGTDTIYGYEEILTAVDVVGTPEAMNNLEFSWDETSDVGPNIHGAKFRSKDRSRELVITTLDKAKAAIESWQPSAVVLPYSADTPLSAAHRTFSPSSLINAWGCASLALWSSFLYTLPWYPVDSLGTALTASLIAVNAIACQKTFYNKEKRRFRNIMKTIKHAQVPLTVFGDWLEEDYCERIFHVSTNDRAAKELKEREAKVASRHGHSDPADAVLDKYTPKIGTLGDGIAKWVPAFAEKLAPVKLSDIDDGKYPNTYRDAVNFRRIDTLAHVANNTDSEKILVCVREIDNIEPEIVLEMLRRKLSSNPKLHAWKPRKVPFEFDENCERVQIVF